MLFVFSFLNKSANNPPITAPYKVLFKGFEVMAQFPLAHPTK
jgi:hypothetical protein